MIHVPGEIKAIAAVLYLPFAFIIEYSKVDTVVVETLTVLIILDIVTGFMKTICVGGKPTSTRLANGIFSKLVLLLIPISVALAAKPFGMDLKFLVNGIMSALILSELYSIIANIYTINTKKEVEEFDVISLILKFIRNKINRILGDVQ